MSNSSASPPFSTLAGRLQVHLECEVQTLQEAVTTLAAVRHALLGSDSATLTEALEQQALAVQNSEAARARQRQLTQEIAETFDKSSQTDRASHGGAVQLGAVQMLGPHLPPEQAAVLGDLRTQLLQLTATAQKLNRQNASLLVQSAELNREILATLTAASSSCDGYAADGSRDSVLGQSIIEVGG